MSELRTIAEDIRGRDDAGPRVTYPYVRIALYRRDHTGEWWTADRIEGGRFRGGCMVPRLPGEPFTKVTGAIRRWLRGEWS